MKCEFHYTHICEGSLRLKNYEKPCDYWDWPIIFLCKRHDREITWQDALNTRSNVNTNDVNMTHTKELLDVQTWELCIPKAEKIVFCSECNGTGEIGYAVDIRNAKQCDKCKCTGLEK